MPCSCPGEFLMGCTLICRFLPIQNTVWHSRKWAQTLDTATQGCYLQSSHLRTMQSSYKKNHKNPIYELCLCVLLLDPFNSCPHSLEAACTWRVENRDEILHMEYAELKAIEEKRTQEKFCTILRCTCREVSITVEDTWGNQLTRKFCSESRFQTFQSMVGWQSILMSSIQQKEVVHLMMTEKGVERRVGGRGRWGGAGGRRRWRGRRRGRRNQGHNIPFNFRSSTTSLSSGLGTKPLAHGLWKTFRMDASGDTSFRKGDLWRSGQETEPEQWW